MPNAEAPRSGRDAPPAELTGAEWAVMKVIWSRQPCSAGDVQEALADERGWAYSTVKTTLDRLVRKGALSLTRIRNLQLFQARITRTEAARSEVRRILARAFDGAVAPLMNHLVAHETLTADDLTELRRLIREKQKREGP